MSRPVSLAVARGPCLLCRHVHPTSETGLSGTPSCADITRTSKPWNAAQLAAHGFPAAVQL